MLQRYCRRVHFFTVFVRCFKSLLLPFSAKLGLIADISVAIKKNYKFGSSDIVYFRLKISVDNLRHKVIVVDLLTLKEFLVFWVSLKL